MKRLPRSEIIWTALCLLALFVIYHNSTAPLSPNDGSHWALMQAIVRDHTFVIDKQVSYTQMVDVSIHGGHYYSDRAPGTAFLGALFELLGLGAKTVPALGGVLAVVLAYVITRRWTDRFPALLTAVAVGFATLTWRYSQLFFSHALAEGLVLAAVWAALRLGGERRPPRWVMLLGGWVIGYAMLTEYQLLLLTPILGAYIVASRVRWGGKGVAGVWPTAVTWGLAAGLLAFYQWHCFGNPWHTSYAYRLGWHEDNAFGGNPLTALQGWLVGVKVPGLLTLSPILWLAMWGAVLLFLRGSRTRTEAGLCLGTFLAIMLATSLHPSWNGASTQDTRYILCITPLLMLPLGAWVQQYLLTPRPAVSRFLYEGLFYFLLLVSIGMNCHALFFHYDLVAGKLSPVIPILDVFNPRTVMFGLLAGVQFDRVLWWFLGAAAVLWVLDYCVKHWREFRLK